MKTAAYAAGILFAVTGAAGAQTLTIGAGAPVTSMDPHYHNYGPNNAATMHVYDRLVERDGHARPHPSLATSWRAVSDTVWEFKLREGVTWHDGKPFTADDVVFTFSRVPNVANSPGGFGGFLRAIERVEVVDPHTFRLHTRQPHPLMPLDLSSVSIIARHVSENPTSEDFNAGRVAIGTGPYRQVSYRLGDRVEFERNDAWFGPAQPWQRVSYRIVGNDGARTAALLAGDVDMIEQIPTTDVARLRRDQRLTVTSIASLRTVYLAPDYGNDGGLALVTDNAGRPLPANPFKDARVRRALSMAINREGLVSQIMEGEATATAQWLPEGAFGFNNQVATRRYDPAAARRLLAEAGYPEGFRVTLAAPNDRWPNDARIAQAVAQMWTRIGVRTQVDALPWTAFVARRARFDFAVQLGAWGSSSGEASNFLVNTLATRDRSRLTGANNNARYSDARFDTLAARGSETLDDAAREAIWHEAVALYAEEEPLIQLMQYVNTWALRRGLAHDPRMDERTVAMGVRPAR
ncbi:ABC transporter substrate-binding protein [Roseomonas terrae]|uniref:ABC transporter substrate-binding protein n=1 Tax=Neoroseomonas terrae TaxID=424799 RepID=A0ABS5EP42_9PROT|nr:ABC transporter substrate-binding protein [Neoroseomonas terrae]MBR0652796.1 ABC transporter substrate-binding protein [Neoroseomonas terrae]